LPNQSEQRSGDLADFCLQFKLDLLGDVFEAMSDVDVVARFAQRRPGDSQKLPAFLGMGASSSFNDIGRHGKRRSAQLGSEFESLVSRKYSERQTMQANEQIICPLPGRLASYRLDS